MRRFILLAVAVALCGGCKTAEFAVQHPVTGLHVVAKFAAQDHQHAQSLLPTTSSHAACAEHAQMQAPIRLPSPLGS